jgi:hypothetical protein
MLADGRAGGGAESKLTKSHEGSFLSINTVLFVLPFFSMLRSLSRALQEVQYELLLVVRR